MPTLHVGEFIPKIPERYLKAVRGVILALYSDGVPRSTTWPQMELANEVWREAPGPLAELRNSMWTNVKQVRTDIGRFIERQYLDDYLPRNVHYGQIFKNKLASIPHVVPSPKKFDFLSVQEIETLLKLLGLGRTKYTPTGYGAIFPANGQASLGLTHDVSKDRYFMGKKEHVWSLLQQSAHRFTEEVLPSVKLRWNDPPSKWQQLMLQHRRCFLPFVRNDGGKGGLKPRLIWGGDAEMYILETELFFQFRKDLHDTWIVPHSVETIRRRFQEVQSLPGQYLSFDYSAWDLTQSAIAQKRVWRAITNVYNMPSNLAKYCAAYNLAGPLYTCNNNREVQGHFRWGCQPSGSGAFVWTNHVLHMVYCVHALMKLLKLSLEEAVSRLGQVYGDDGWVRTTVSAKQWSDHCIRHYGIIMKPKQTAESSDTIVFLRRLFNLRNSGWEPVVMSRWRNALCPRFTDPGNADDALKAVVARAQFVEVAQNDQAKQGKYGDILKLWLSVVRAETFMYPQSDAELVAQLPKYAWEYGNSLERIKRWMGILDVSDVLSNLL